MATASSNMKGFYRQKKKKSGIRKSTSTNKSSLIHAATLGSDITQPTALVSHDSPDLKDDYDKHEDVLRQFDMNMAYGPCLGMSRLARWERAQRLGLNPPKEIEGLLKGERVRSECLWDGCI
ncbi:PREDICTED: DNA polymerase delta subunit 4 [Populus euphratica]|uniref:DNA polymerase delta subunit 4 n=1 Tax=Populus euphratica TaxID=75702 RepID=A0AAJ6XEM2_POPEU|nr:PREDICTED: DNA polymerase delta subunit 4 [Populus euphratica]